MKSVTIWRLLMLYMAAIWTELVLTAFGVTGWSWRAALAPFWVPGALMMIALIVADIWHPSRETRRAIRRRLHAVRRAIWRHA